ncbi:NADPH:adrenodoxin oxidoreductase mitochondrial [Taenia crassiceps]|uniref:NADPH:adrenodoxin oxidoreductase mitochondrial n=1 Tax=Taenia crassiceps TaxID=6207 RepID=A0ABR4Q9D0_9CEST
MNHLSRGAYTTFHSPPTTICSTERFDNLPPSHRGSFDNEISLMSGQFGQTRLDDTAPDLISSRIHFPKWYHSAPGANSGGGGGGQRSSSLSPKPTEPTVQLAYRPPTPQVQAQIPTPTPTHRGILKGQRPSSEAGADSPRGGFTGRGFWDSVDLNSEVHDSCNSIASSNLGDSLSRKTVRFADGKPAMSSRTTQVPYDSVRGTTIRTNGAMPQGIYEWEPDEGLIIPGRTARDLNKPPRPPKMRPAHRLERRVTTDCVGLPPRIRYAPAAEDELGVATSSPMGYTSLRGPESPATPTGSVDDSYANYESIYRSRGRRASEGGEVEKIDSHRLDVLMRPYMTSTNPEVPRIASSPSTPPPPFGSSEGPIYRTEVKITDLQPPPSSQSAPPSPPLPSTPSAPLHFVYTVKPSPHRLVVDSDTEEGFGKTGPRFVDDTTLRPHSLQSLTTPLTPRVLGPPGFPIPSLVNDSRGTLPPRLLNCRKQQIEQQMPPQAQQSKRHQPLRVDVSQPTVSRPVPLLNGKSMPPLHGLPFTEGSRRRGNGTAEAHQSTDLKTGSLDRDGVWRPNRLPMNLGGVGGSPSPVAHNLTYAPSPLLADLLGGYPRFDRQHLRHSTRFFSPFSGGSGGYEVPIFVVHSNTTSTPTPSFRRRTLSPSSVSAQRGTNAANVPIKKNGCCDWIELTSRSVCGPSDRNRGARCFVSGNMLGFPSLIRRTIRKCIQNKNLRVCIVGSGPSGFYVAQSLLKRHGSARIDLLEKLPIPFGLVRYGVAPDHPEVKNVITTFTQVAMNPRFHYYGNIAVGDDVSLAELRHHYDAIVLAYGASADKRMNISGEELPGVLSAKKFVGWYNGYPDSQTPEPCLDCETVAIVGMGNVSLDVARILLSSVDRLKNTDIPEPVIEHLSTSRVRRVIIIGRRGPLQAAFTLKEFRELCCLPKSKKTSLQGLRVEFTPQDIFDEALSTSDGRTKLLAELPRPRRRLIEHMLKISTLNSMPIEHDVVSEPLCCEIRFLRSPIQVVPRYPVSDWVMSPPASSKASNVAGIELCVNKLKGPPGEGQKCVVAEGESPELVECGLVVRSIGHRSVCIDPDLPFNEDRGVVVCIDEYGRVPGLLSLGDNYGIDGDALLYASGWAKVGGMGVIVNTLADARNTADAILTDLGHKDSLPRHIGFDGFKEILKRKGVRPVTFADWERVDVKERVAGRGLGKPREKITSLKEILRTAFLEVAKARNGEKF